MADRFGMERPTYFPSFVRSFVLWLRFSVRLPWPVPLANLNDVAQFTSRRKYMALRHCSRCRRDRRKEKRKKKNERGKWKRSGVVSGFIRLLRNESSENGRVRVDHKKRITTASRRCRYTYRCGVVAAARRASEKPDYHRYSPRNEISCWETFWIDRTIGSWRSAYKYLEYWRTYFDFILGTFLRAVDRASFRLGESKHTALLSVNEIFCESVYSK